MEGKGTESNKNQLGAVEEEGNGGGVWGLEGNKGSENHYGWDFIFSGEEERQLVVEGKHIYCFMIGEVYFRNGPGWVLGWVLIRSFPSG